MSQAHKAKLLKIGEFAKLCQTTKDTILHYEKKDLLKPIFVDSNNYRYYATSQYLIFDKIKILQDAGYSLIDIKSTQSNEHNYSDFINHTLTQVQEQIHRLKLKENMLQNILNLIDEIEHCTFDKLEFINLKTIALLSYKLNDEEKNIETIEDGIKLYKKVMHIILQQQNNEQLILGLELDNKTCSLTKPIKVLCSSDAINTHKLDVEAISEGLYAIYYHKDDFIGHTDCITKLRTQIQSLGYSIVKAYIIDLYSVFSNDSTDKLYKAKYMFKLEAKSYK